MIIEFFFNAEYKKETTLFSRYFFPTRFSFPETPPDLWKETRLSLGRQ